MTIEKIIADYPFNYPQVIKYKGACPMEDCGGIEGYYQCLEIMADKGHPEHDERRLQSSKAWISFQSMGRNG